MARCLLSRPLTSSILVYPTLLTVMCMGGERIDLHVGQGAKTDPGPSLNQPKKIQDAFVAMVQIIKLIALLHSLLYSANQSPGFKKVYDGSPPLAPH